MPDTSLEELLERNARHVESLHDDHFDAVQDAQQPAAVSICCSDSRVPQDGMWDVEDPGWLFTPSTIGNQVWDIQDGERVVDGSLLYPMVNTETDVTLVVGHTGCGAVTAALDAVQHGAGDVPPGIEKWVDLLVPVVEAGLDDERVDADRDVSLVDQLVEYNVDRQIEFLLESDDVPETETVYGFVYDFQGVYTDERGRAYLVNVDGETDVAALRELAPAEYHDAVDRLLP
ncbi:carbonic anhydrase [Natranaeroarchaeum aerophilus]|uniref:carbonic anhydrase n=1 Tax=Natranaeroarchaeum aerophilus TaxID=2917711 RepID=A0AAE3K3I4_9EURY|nr:carbonic anhydrase [Natranaeroarchaeum aerophilus]MCL9812652.1 carbonic anhydrase [Natranaeroarchaeum aerophilus]